MHGGAAMEFKVLAVGDVVGNPGLERIRRSLRYLKRKCNADFVVVNGENAAVVGITPNQAEDILDAGIREFSHQLIEVSPFKNSTNKMANIAYMMDREVYQHLHSLYQSLKRSIDKMGAKTGLSQ